MSSGGDSAGLSRAERIAQQRRELPDSPGVYLFHDGDGEILYVGAGGATSNVVGSDGELATLPASFVTA